MLFCDLLRVTVLLVAGVATALGAVTVIVANQDADEVALAVAGGWWLLAAGDRALARALGAGGGGDRAAARRRAHRDQPAAREPGPDRVHAAVADRRLRARWSGVAGWVWPQVAAIGAGYAILIALAWRGREHAVAAIEERDGVRFYVEPSSAFEPVKLIRTPGLYRDRAPTAEAATATASRLRAPALATARRALKSGRAGARRRSRRRRRRRAPRPRRGRGRPAGPATSASQPTIGPPIGVEPRKTTE